MTAVLADLDAAPGAARTRRRGTTIYEHMTVAALVVWWLWPLTRATGGREPHQVSVGLMFMVLAVIATRPWRRLRPLELVGAASLVGAALVVCLSSPTGWRGANDLGVWAFAAGFYVVVRAYLSVGGRLGPLMGVFALAGLVQFAESWLAWWGNEDPSRPMLGTFYWHNQFAAFLLVPALLGLALAVWPRRPGLAVGWAAAPLCSVGVLFSTSRATIALLALGWGSVLVVALVGPARRAPLLRYLAVAATTVAMAFVLTGPPFFPHRAAPSAAVAARSERQSASGDASYRTITWRQAAEVYVRHPVTGTGFHGFASAAAAAEPDQPHSAFAHNAWLQALADGGTALGLPFLLASLVAGIAIARKTLRRVRSRTNPRQAVAGVAALLLAAHSLVDFDISYPALFAALAFAATFALAPNDDDPLPAPPIGPVHPVAVAAVAVLAAIALVAVVPSWHGDLRLSLTIPGGASMPGGNR